MPLPLEINWCEVTIMRKIVKASPKEYCSQIKSRLDSPFLLGQARFTGWCIGPFFSVNYYSGKEFGKRHYSISNKAMGIAKNSHGQTCVSYFIFPGLSDPISIALMFIASLIIFGLVGTPIPAVFALGWTALVVLHTVLCTVLTEAGEVGKRKLQSFLRF